MAHPSRCAMCGRWGLVDLRPPISSGWRRKLHYCPLRVAISSSSIIHFPCLCKHLVLEREREGMRDDKVMLTVQTHKAGHHGVHASKGIHHHHPERCASSHQRVLLLSVPLKEWGMTWMMRSSTVSIQEIVVESMWVFTWRMGLRQNP